MVREKSLIDRLAALESFVHSMPVVNTRLAQFPAKIDFFTVQQRRKINKTDVQIFDQATDFFNFLHGRFQELPARIALLPVRQHLAMVHHHAPEHHNAPREILHFLFSLLVAGLRGDGILNNQFHFRKQSFSLVNGEESRHPSDAGNLHSQGAAAWAIELGENNVLPRAEKHGSISHLQTKRLAHEHATHV
jgi:hypothetical protein